MSHPLSRYFSDLSRGLKRFFLPGLLLIAMGASAQNFNDQKAKLEKLKTSLDAKHKAAQKRVALALSKSKSSKSFGFNSSTNKLQRRFVDKDGRTNQLVDILKDGTPLYYVTSNSGAAQTVKTTALYPGGALGLNLTGAGESAGVWDEGTARLTHEIFGSRAFKLDDAPDHAAHSTHVGGTIMGSGAFQNGRARGMAYDANLLSYDWNNDMSEVATAVAERNLLVSNHSYGWAWVPMYIFGKYTSYAADWDQLFETAPYYLQVKAAGNPRMGLNIYYPERDGFDNLTDFSLCKNNLVVAAVNETNYTGPASVSMSPFSAYGPTDDGRIKPDISAKGVNTFSATNESDDSYGTYSGTSMAAPSATGSLLLLQQYHKQLKGTYMKAATLKGIALHTASEAGIAPGPDYRFGWGLLNMEAAAKVVRDNGVNAYVQENTLANGQEYTFQVIAKGTEPVVASICWTDPRGAANDSEVENERAPVLVNDLDIRVYDGNTEHMPWLLNPYKPNDAAKRGDNKVDNIEKVELVPAYAGQVFTIKVRHKGILQNPQAYSLIVTGVKQQLVSCTTPVWLASKVYVKGDEVSLNGNKYRANWWNQNQSPATNSGPWQVWTLLGPCGGNNQAPSVSVVAPLASTTLTGLNPIQIKVSASDADGTISMVLVKITNQYETAYYPTTLVGGNYELSYTPTAYGTLNITAVAVDNLEKASEQTVLQKVWESTSTPTLTVISPVNNQTVYAGFDNLVAVTAPGSVNRGMGVFVSGVDFTFPAVQLTGEGPDFRYNFVPDASLIDQTITLRVELKSIATGTVVAFKNIVLNVRTNNAPVIEMVSSPDTVVVPVNSSWLVRLKATDNDDMVSRVYMKYFDGNDLAISEFNKQGDLWIGTMNFTPYTTNPEQYEVAVWAVDNIGASSYFKYRMRVLSQNDQIPPVVEFATPTPDQEYVGAIPQYRVRLQFATYNPIVEGPEYLAFTNVYLDGVQVMHFDWVKKYGLGLDTAVRLNSYGTHVIRIETTDERGLMGVGERVITLRPLDRPTISIVSPAQQEVVYIPVGGTTMSRIDVDVNDEEIQIDSVWFIVVDIYSRHGNVRRFTVTEAPFDLDFLPNLDAFYTEITAVAFSNGNGVSAHSTAKYRPDLHPTIAILTPVDGTVYTATPSTLPTVDVTVDVNNEEIFIDSIIYTVEELVNGPVVTRYAVYTAPYNLSFTANISSRTRIYATAWGNSGRYSTTALTTIYVNQETTGCTADEWDPAIAYSAGAQVQYNGIRYKSKWWTLNENPASHSGQWDVWLNLGICNSKTGDADAEWSNALLQVYPNPSSGMVNIKTNMKEAYTISVQQASGMEVYHQSNITTEIHPVNLSSFAKGIYIVKLISGDRVDVQQLVIE